METIKKYFAPVIACFAALTAGAFLVARFFLVKKEKTELFPQTQKKKLEKEKKALEKESSQLDKKEYSEQEIKDKFNS